MTDPVLEQLRALGLPMISRYAPITGEDENGEPYARQRFVSWTTDETKATAAGDLGALVVPYRSFAEGYSGWEVSCVVAVPVPA